MLTSKSLDIEAITDFLGKVFWALTLVVVNLVLIIFAIGISVISYGLLQGLSK